MKKKPNKAPEPTTLMNATSFATLLIAASVSVAATPSSSKGEPASISEVQIKEISAHLEAYKRELARLLDKDAPVAVEMARIAISEGKLQAAKAPHATESKSGSQRVPAEKEEKPGLELQLESAKKYLAQMLTQFTEESPRVKNQRQKIADLEEQLAKRKSEKRTR